METICMVIVSMLALFGCYFACAWYRTILLTVASPTVLLS